MAEVRNGQAEYGIRHLVEEEMREKGVGVFAKRATRKASVTEDDAEPKTARRTKARK